MFTNEGRNERYYETMDVPNGNRSVQNVLKGIVFKIACDDTYFEI